MSDIFVAFGRRGVSRDVFDITYQKTKESGWNPICQAGLIFNKLPDGFVDDIERIFSDSHKYIFDDALVFLKDNPTSKYILSFGDKLTQLKKIERAGITSYLDSVNITSDQSKKDFFGRLGGGRTMFIDDKPKVINTIKANFPGVFCVLMRRGLDLTVSPDIHADAIIRTFADFNI